MINCPYCGKLADPKLDSCPHCGGPIQTVSPPSSKGAAASKGKGENCPNCGAVIRDSDIICVKCGTNLLTGQKVVAEQPEPTAPSARPNRKMLFLLLGLVGILIIALLLLLLFLAGTGDPVENALHLHREGNTMGAVDILREYTDTHNQDAKAHQLLGKMFWSLSRFNDAAESFERASNAGTDDASVQLLNILAKSKSNNPNVLAQRDALLQQYAQSHPEDEQGQLLLGLTQATQGNFEAAINTLQSLEERGESSEKIAQTLAIALTQTGSLEQAREKLEEAVSSGTPSGDSLAILGIIASSQGRDKEARAYLEQARGTNALTEVKTRLALLHMVQNNYAQAAPLLKEVRMDTKAPPAARFLHALCLMHTGDEAEALQEFDRIANMQDNPLAGESAIQMARIMMDQEKVDRALTMLARARQLKGDPARTSTLEGLAYLQTNDFNAAHQAFRSAIRENPAYAPAHLENGLMYLRRGVPDEALRELERYLKLSQTSSSRVENELRVFVDQLRQTLQEANG